MKGFCAWSMLGWGLIGLSACDNGGGPVQNEDAATHALDTESLNGTETEGHETGTPDNPAASETQETQSDSSGQYAVHEPIFIDGDTDLVAQAALRGWPGSGASNDPIVIEGLEIDLANRAGGCIEIRHTRLFLTIRGCYLHGGGKNWTNDALRGYGVLATDVQNLSIEDCVLTENYEGVRLVDSRFCTVARSDLSQCAGHGIGLASTHESLIEHNVCANEHDDGILLGSFNLAKGGDPCNNNVIRFNDLHHNSSSGICLFRGSGNFIYGNAFGEGNGVFVLNTGGANTWDNEDEKRGNWWFNFTAPDEDSDGIVDEPRSIAGGAVDRYPLVAKPNICKQP